MTGRADEIREIMDGVALWEEHKPQSGEDWVAVAGRCLRGVELGLNGSPIFRALMIQTAALGELLAERDRLTETLRETTKLADSLQERLLSLPGAYGAEVCSQLLPLVLGIRAALAVPSEDATAEKENHA